MTREHVDVAAGTVTVLTVVNVLPAVAAAFAIGSYVIGYDEKFSGKPFLQSGLAELFPGDWA